MPSKLFRPHIVVLDGYTLNPGDLSWAKLHALGHVEIFDRSPDETVVDRAEGADILLVNKVILDRERIERLPKLKCICVTASGYNNIDIAAASERGIPVCNAVGYGSESVAQHVFALLLEMTNNTALHHQSVMDGEWTACPDFSYTKKPIIELAGKIMGIYGFGRIGRKVAEIALAFGMEVIAVHKHPQRDAHAGVEFVNLETLFSQSDVVTLHASMTEENQGIVGEKYLAMMKPTAFLINTGRGGLIDETALKTSLETNRIAGAALDVLAVEPPPAQHPLLGVPNCLITPHQAWASREARQRLIDITLENTAAFIKGSPQNVVNPQYSPSRK